MRYSFYFISLVIIFFSCQKNKSSIPETQTEEQAKNKNMKNGILHVDVNADYPRKEKIYIQNIADVKYIPLETTDDFICPRYPAYIDDEIIIFSNRQTGDILIFDANGKTKKRINKKGASGEEYVGMQGLVYDKENNELFINDMHAKKIVVYDLNGNYKRSFFNQNGIQYMRITNFDEDNLLCYYPFHVNENPFVLISKSNGKKIADVFIPFVKRIDPDITWVDEKGVRWGVASDIPYLVKNGNHILLNEISSDTIYQLNQDITLTPLIVRTPSINKTESSPFLYSRLDISSYLFFSRTSKIEDLEQPGFMTDCLVYDKKTDEINDANFFNKDCDERIIFSENQTFDNKAVISYSADELEEAFKKNKLNGELKEIASTLQEDDNPVLMVVKFK